MELNKVYCMDNLELLKQIENETIDLIYCDVLYGTGRDFGDYKDLQPKKDIVEEFYFQRLTEMKRILKNTGSIYLQCDYRINHWIRCLMDDIFGYKNFRNEIVWIRSNSNKNISNKYPDNTDKILFYAKSNENKFNVQCKLENIDVYDICLQHTGSDSNRECRPNLWYPFYYNEKNNVLSLDYIEDSIEIYPVSTNSIEKRWKWSRGKSKKEIDNLFVKKINGRYSVYRKSNNYKKINISNIWDDKLIINTIYPTEKPKSIIDRIVRSSSDEGDIVADFFCGSGTTMVVAKELNRKYLGCDINSRAIEITNKRLNEVKNTYKDLNNNLTNTNDILELDK